jgi:hypothetical protein
MRQRFILAACALLVICSTAFAADKGGPPVRVDAAGAVKPMFNGCFVQGAGTLIYAEAVGASEAVRAFMAGAGCDMQRGKLIFGAMAEYGFGESDVRVAALTGRIGVEINPHLMGYGFLTLTMDGRSIKLDDSMLSAGVGLETYIGSKHWTVFGEISQTVKTFGTFDGVDATTAKFGARYRF